MPDIKIIADKADIIVNGYAFTRKGDCVHVLNLYSPGAKGQVPVTRLVTCTSPSSTSSPQRCLWMKPRPIPVSLCSCRTVALENFVKTDP